MRLLSVVYALGYYLFFFLFFPVLLIYVNTTFHLPVFHNQLFQLIGVCFIGVGIGNSLYCYWVFFTKGKGTPVPIQPTKKLMTNGVFGYIRNPLYVGQFILTLGIFLFFGHILLVFLIMLFSLWAYIAVSVEEKELIARFGDDYIAYTKSVPKYIPKIF